MQLFWEPQNITDVESFLVTVLQHTCTYSLNLASKAVYHITIKAIDISAAYILALSVLGRFIVFIATSLPKDSDKSLRSGLKYYVMYTILSLSLLCPQTLFYLR